MAVEPQPPAVALRWLPSLTRARDGDDVVADIEMYPRDQVLRKIGLTAFLYEEISASIIQRPIVESELMLHVHKSNFRPFNSRK